MQIPSFIYESQYKDQGYKLIAGVDEVGRGALAGPIVAAAVIFTNYGKTERLLTKINDSKIIEAQKRIELNELIIKKAYDFAIGSVSVEEIDRMGIGAANILAFKRALDGLKKVDYALIDGRKFRGFDRPFSCFIKGESKSISIAAASIVAKVFRDNLMIDLAQKEKRYLFDLNKGYGGEEHYQALEKYGPSVHHRKTFLRKFHSKSELQSLF